MVAGSAQARVGRPRDRGVDDRIRRATWQVAGRRRRPSVAMGNVACAAGAGKPSLYRRFDGVEALLAWLVDDATAHRKALPDCGELRRDLDAARAHFASIVGNPRSRRGWLAVIDAAASSPPILHALDRALSARRDDVSDIFRRARARGEIEAGADPMVLAEVFLRLVVAELTIGPVWTADSDAIIEVVLDAARSRTTEMRS